MMMIGLSLLGRIGSGRVGSQKSDPRPTLIQTLIACSSVTSCARRHAENHVGREATHQVPAEELSESGRGRASGVQPVGHDQGPVRTAADPDPRDGREEPSAHHQRLEQIREFRSRRFYSLTE